jgi:thiamine biosynthesis lipoprotein
VRLCVLERVERYDRTWSRFREDSLVSAVARTPGRHPFPPEGGELLALYRALYEATDGAVSPLVARSLEALGYDSHYTLRAGGAVPTPAWDDAVAWDGEALTTVNPVLLDVGAAGKGQLVDLVGEELEFHGIRDYLIDASGDMLHRGSDVVRVALENPAATEKAIGVAELSGQALCSSASNRRAWAPGVHHVVDARTGLSTETVIATWALAPSALAADGIATALFFTDPARLLAVAPFDYVRMFRTGRIERSASFPGEVFA